MADAVSEAAEQEQAALTIQNTKKQGDKKKEALNAVSIKKSQCWKAVEKKDAARLKAALADSGVGSELALKDSEGRSLLQVALEAASLPCAELLVARNEPLGFPEAKELAAWAELQAARKPGPDEEGEIPEPPDVNDEEWQAEFATKVSLDKLDVKRIVQLGLYAGGRAAAPTDVEPSFDGELTPREGFGVSLGPAGDVYVGSFAAGAREGMGALRLAAGGSYAGAWKGGKRHGQGRSLATDGSVYEGEWRYNKRHGRGCYTYPTGDTYTGEWFAGVKHGAGRYRTAATGTVTEGTWQHGVMKAAKVAASDGSAFYGKFDKTGRPTGGGAYVFPNGALATGSYAAPPLPEEAEEGEKPEPATWGGKAVEQADHVADGVLKATLCAVKGKPNVIICGAPASGKGTQCEKIKESMGLVHISTGDMLREAAADEGNEDGQKAKELMEAGELVPDELIFALVKGRLSQPDCIEKGWLLDGFPRTGEQARLMEENFLVPSVAILLEVPAEILVERVTGRRLDPETGTIYHMKFNPPSGENAEEITARLTQRGDDTEEALQKRLVNYDKNKEAVSEAFANILKKIDGAKAAEEVWADVNAALRS